MQYTKEINPRFYYSNFIAFISKIIPLKITFYILTVFANYLILFITYKTIKSFGATSLAALASIFFLFNYKIANLGGAGTIIDYYLIPQLISIPFALTAFISSIMGNFIFVLVFLLISFIFQPSLALLFFVPIASNILQNETIKNKYIKTIFLFFLLVSLTFILFPNNINHVLNNEFLIKILAYFRHPHHYIPSKFPLNIYKEFILLTLSFFISLVYLNKKTKRQKYLIKSFFYSGLFSLLIMIIGYIFVELILIKQIVELQTFRIVSLFRWMTFVTFFSAFYIFISQKLNPLFIKIIYITLIVFLIISLFYKKKLSVVPNLNQFTDIKKKNIYEFIVNNTNPQAIFLAPPDFGDMRVVPKRAIVVDWKSFPFNEKDMSEWYERIINCYGSSSFENNYLQINDLKLNELKNKYSFNYVILYTETETGLNVIYSDKLFKLIKI